MTPLAVLALALWAQSAAPWAPVTPGVEYGRFALGAGDSLAHVVRVDPGRARIEVHTLGEHEEPMGVREWCESRELVFAANAGMFAEDRRTHIGYFKIQGREFVPRIHPQYQSAALFHPMEPGLPPFRILDLDEEDLEAWRLRYATVIQNLRLIKATRENRWTNTSRKWSELALGQDASGRMLFVFTRIPFTMAEWNTRVMALPLGLIAAQHLEGGSEAQFYLRLPDGEVFERGGWLGSPTGIPSVIGVSK